MTFLFWMWTTMVLLDREFCFQMCFSMPVCTSLEEKSFLPQCWVKSTVLAVMIIHLALAINMYLWATTCVIQIAFHWKVHIVHTHTCTYMWNFLLTSKLFFRTCFWKETLMEIIVIIASIYWALTICKHRFFIF